MSAEGSRPGFSAWPLKRLTVIQSSNVDKVIADGEQTVRLCNYVDVYYNKIISDRIPFAAGSANPTEIEKFSLRADDIIITKDSETADDIAVAAIVEPSAAGVICGYHLAMLRPNPHVVWPKYLFWCLSAPPIRDAFSVRAQGVTRFGLTLNGIGNVSILIPDLATQRAVATFLDRETAHLDQLIERKERQIALLVEKKASTIRELVRGGRSRTRMKKTSDRWLPQVPEHWEPIRLRYLYRATKRQGMPELDVLSVYREFGVILKSSRDDNINKTPEDLSLYQLVEPGDLVINKMKAWQGSLGVSSVKGITSPDYLVYKPIRPMVGRFMHHYLRAQPMPSLYLSISNGIRTDQWRLEHEKFADVVVWLPPITEQERIAEAIDAESVQLDSVVERISRSVNSLRERRAALITAAVTGQIDVRQQPTAVPAKPHHNRFRVIVGAEIVHRHQANPKFGRVKLQKELYLAEVHAGIDELQGAYLREAAGPLDRALVEETERGMKASSFFDAALPDIHGKSNGVTYTPLDKAGQHGAELETLLGSRVERLRAMIDLLRDFETRSVEAIATLYAAWNDALIDGKALNDSAIIQVVLDDWHPEKREKFTSADLQHWLDWMNRNKLIPRGTGPRTTTGRLFV